jgi:hypothetical protein
LKTQEAFWAGFMCGILLAFAVTLYGRPTGTEIPPTTEQLLSDLCSNPYTPAACTTMKRVWQQR